MANPQITQYVKEQLKSGVPKDEVKKILLGAGWAEADVVDALKEAGDVAPVASPASPAVSPMDVLSKSSVGDVFKPGAEPAASAAAAQPAHHVSVPLIAVSAFAFIFAGLSGYLFWVSSSSSSDTTGLRQQVSALNSSVMDLQTKLADATKANADMTAQLKALKESQEASGGLLSFYVGSGTSTVSVDLKGTLAGGAGKAYTLTTAEGIKVNLKNGTDEKVAAALAAAPTSAPVSIAGTHMPKSFELTVTSVNGTPIQ